MFILLIFEIKNRLDYDKSKDCTPSNYSFESFTLKA